MSGKGGADTLYGLGGPDDINGNNGDDKISGGSGNDGLLADSGGADKVCDGFGVDIVRTNDGAPGDVVYAIVDGSNDDIVVDSGDTIFGTDNCPF